MKKLEETPNQKSRHTFATAFRQFWQNMYRHASQVPTCLFCAEVLAEGYICLSCRAKLPTQSPEFLTLCQNRARQNGLVAFQGLWHLFDYQKQSRVQGILHEIKYKNNPRLAQEMGRWLGHLLQETNQKWDLLLPVPLHAQKLRQRGYNQSEEIAKGVAEVLAIPLGRDMLQRKTHGESQTNKNALQRFLHVKNSFACTAEITAKHVLLIDDVFTTGSTLEALALCILQKNPHLQLSVATLARAGKLNAF